MTLVVALVGAYVGVNMGKVQMELSPFLNHWWHVTFDVIPRGLTTSAIPFHGGTFDVIFDFIEHNLFIRTSLRAPTKPEPGLRSGIARRWKREQNDLPFRNAFCNAFETIMW